MLFGRQKPIQSYITYCLIYLAWISCISSWNTPTYCHFMASHDSFAIPRWRKYNCGRWWQSIINKFRPTVTSVQVVTCGLSIAWCSVGFSIKVQKKVQKLCSWKCNWKYNLWNVCHFIYLQIDESLRDIDGFGYVGKILKHSQIALELYFVGVRYIWMYNSSHNYS